MDQGSVARLCRSSGCEISPEERGGFHPAHCPTFESKVQLLDDLASHDAMNDPMVRRVGMEIARTKPTREAEDLAPAIHAYVRDHVPYLGEGQETFQSTSLCTERLSQIRWTARPGSTVWSIWSRKSLKSSAACRAEVFPITLPVAVFSAANRSTVPCRS